MITLERFAQGLDFAAYAEKLGDDGHKFLARQEKIKINPADAVFFAAIREPVHILILSEGWCPDCVVNVPIIAQIAQLNPRLQIKIFPRDENLDIMDAFLTDEKRTIPTIVFFDGEFREIGRWIERPAAVRKGFVAGTKEEKAAVKRDYLQGKYENDTVKEIRRILER